MLLWLVRSGAIICCCTDDGLLRLEQDSMHRDRHEAEALLQAASPPEPPACRGCNRGCQA